MLIKEFIDNTERDKILDAVVSNFGTLGSPYKGPSFILPDGKFLDIRKLRNHADVEFWLDSQGLSRYHGYDIRTAGCPTLKDIGCIRVDTPKYYIHLPQDNITSQQYDSLKDWVIFLIDECNIHDLLILAPNASRGIEYSNIDENYIIDRVRKYYIFGKLYENKRRLRL